MTVKKEYTEEVKAPKKVESEIYKTFAKTYVVGTKKYHQGIAYKVTFEEAKELVACVGSDCKASTKEEIAKAK